jgi:hypothetical protein
MAARSRSEGAPESNWLSDEWQVTTWLSEDKQWVVRVDGPDGRFWETGNLPSRSVARKEGSKIVQGFIDHAR